MGGIGSGNWNRQRSHETVDSFPEFFAIDFKKPAGEVIANREMTGRDMKLPSNTSVMGRLFCCLDRSPQIKTAAAC